MIYQNKIDHQKLVPYAPSRNSENLRVFAYTCVRHGIKARWIKFFTTKFLCLQFYAEIARLHADQEMHTMNTKLVESGRS